MDSAQRSGPRRFVGWVWDTNHDDQVPTVIHSVLVSAMIIVVPLAAASVLSAVGIIALLVALALGTAFSGMGGQESRDAGSSPPADRIFDKSTIFQQGMCHGRGSRN